MMDAARLSALIREVPDFPKPGINFYDVTTLLRDATGFRLAVDCMAAPFRSTGVEAVVGIESRGFIFAAPIARELGCGFVPVRKPGKLPAATLRQEYALEYGTDAVEIHADAVTSGQRVLVVDDLLATGGTMAATCQLLERLRATVCGVSFLIELRALGGRARLAGRLLESVIQY
jgi:adenine phosphoribosyltransferase